MNTDTFLGSTAVVIGASSGIGACISELLGTSGANVILVGRNKNRLSQLASSLPQANFIVADISTGAGCKGLASSISIYSDAIDYFVFCAGVFYPQSIEEQNEDTWDLTFNTNTKGAFFSIQKSLPLLRKGKGKSIVVISSALAHVGAVKAAAYCASKGGLSALVRAFACELASEGIRINSISPGHVDTPMIKVLLSKPSDYKHVLSQYPLGRIGTPSDVARLTLFLLSSSASWITGVDYCLDGGRSILG